MIAYSLKRLSQFLVVFILASVVVFVLVRTLPGDPAVLLVGIDASPEAIAGARERLALDQPAAIQYFAWASQFITGDLGVSFATRQPVIDEIRRALGPSLLLLAGAVVVGGVFAAIAGTLGALTRGSWVDTAITSLVSLLYGMPAYWIGLLGILLFSVYLGVLPTGGYISPFRDLGDALRSLAMPAVVLGLSFGGVIARFVRSSLIDELEKAYVVALRAKGAPMHHVVSKHVARNATIPVITVFGIRFAALLGQTIAIEIVFAWPGIGSLLVSSVRTANYPTLQATILMLVFWFALVNLITDLMYGVTDPRVRERVRAA